MTRPDNVVQISQFRDAWPAVEAMIRDLVRGQGHDAATADWVVQDFRRRDFQLVHLSSASFDEVPPDVRPHLGELSQGMKDAYGRIMVDWLVRIVLLEIDLYSREHR